MKINVGIFFGGSSCEREISFISGRTVYDNLNRSLFNPIPIFVDSFGNWVLINWQHLYKKGIRDFYPSAKITPSSSNGFQIYIESIRGLNQAERQELLSEIGQPLAQKDVHKYIDVAFLTLHGVYGEDGQIQQILESLHIPYTGTGVKSSLLGINDMLRKEAMTENGFATTPLELLTEEQWLSADIYSLYQQIGSSLGFPIKVRAAQNNAGISTGIITKDEGIEGFERAVNQAFFRELIALDEWQDRSIFERVEFVKMLNELEDGLGFPLKVTLGAKKQTIHHPEDLLTFLNAETAAAEYLSQVFVLEREEKDKAVIFEAPIQGKAFSCMAIRAEDGSVIALHPSDFEKNVAFEKTDTTKLLQASDQIIESIRRACESLFSKLRFQVYTIINGHYSEDGLIYLNQVKTSAAIESGSFFFQQAAQIGLNPSQFLTYILRISLQERLKEQTAQEAWKTLLERLDQQILQLHIPGDKKKIAVLLGGYSYERHLSVESGRNVFEKLASSVGYTPVPVFLSGATNKHDLFEIPVALLMKGDADVIKTSIANWTSRPLLDKIRKECVDIIQKYAAKNALFVPQKINYDILADKVDGAFIALHGRPGEDGQVQMQLETRHLAYNGSGIKSANITIDKFRTLQLLKKHGFLITEQLLLSKQDFNIDKDSFLLRVERKMPYPFIAKPVDDGCSSAVKIIQNRDSLRAYTSLLFGEYGQNEYDYRRTLKLKTKEAFPLKGEVLFEKMITQGNGIHFLEVTGGLFTYYSDGGQLRYQSFELSEIIAGQKETFTTPAKLAVGTFTHEYIQQQVQHTFERAARLLKVEGYCCIDAFVRVLPDGKVETQIIEVNSLPDMTADAIIFEQAAFAGQKPEDFINKMLTFGFKRAQKKANVNIIPLKKVEQPKIIESVPAPTLTTIQTLHTSNMDETNKKQSSPLAGKQPLSIALKERFLKIKNFISSRYFLKNIGAMAGIVLLAFLLLNLFLSTYTAHGRSVQVENYTGLSLENAKKKAAARGFAIQVNEAPFSLDISPGEVIDQEPVALSRIKKNRTIYLTVIGGPKEPKIPSFQDAADEYKQYVPMLNALQIKSRVKEEIFDAKLGNGTIQYFIYRGKKYTPSDVKRGVKIRQGSTLEFVITKNLDDNVRLPSLICKRFEEVQFLLEGSDLEVGDINGNVPNRADAFVWKQEPEYSPGKRVLSGSSINVFLQKERPAGCPAEVEINAPESDSGGLKEEEVYDNDTIQKRIPTAIDTSGN